MPIAALIFDLDGTLVDSEAPGLDVLHQMAADLGAPWGREEMHALFGGVPMARCVSTIAQHVGVQHQPLDEVVFLKQLRLNMATRFRAGLKEIPGATALLKSLQATNRPFAIGTNGPREKAEITLGVTGLRDYFGDRLFCAPDVGSFKPEPGLFLHAAAVLGVEPSACGVVEDSLPGIQAGLAAGMQVFSLHPRQGLPAQWAERIQFIDDLHQLRVWLG
ncbi:HAD family phosphatase [Limnohabitans sp. Jir72]|uniref:HAD family hydrolase n=1 Tax=Limnohabitans sp. Jir72 TaxID=1977909 RepID=UPI000D378E2D|nr:HAD-IA family hydrolase [Limnohabitans sp. Jir72]